MANRPTAAVLGATDAGLTLASALASRFGAIALWEPDPTLGRAARNAPGVATVSADLPRTVTDAAVVACAVRRRELVATLEMVAPHLATGAVVLVEVVGHEDAHADAARLLPSHASVACVTTFPAPVESPRLDASLPARSDQRRWWGGIQAGAARRGGQGGDGSRPGAPHIPPAAGISPAPGAHADAVGVVQAILEAAGAVPFYGDPPEIDSLAARALALPIILGAAAVRAALGSAGGRDLERAGGHPLAAVTSVLDPAHLDADEIHALRVHVARLATDVAGDLARVRELLADAPSDAAAIGPAATRRRAWLAARAVPADAAGEPPLPSPSRGRPLL